MSQTATKHKYLATFILDTRNYAEPVETLIEKITTTINAVGGEVNSVKNLGQKEFVRVTDRKYPAGIYVQYEMEAPAEVPSALQEKFRLDRTVNRILVQSK